MGRKKQKDDERKEKPVFGSGAEPLPEPKDDGLVKCVCTVPCAWRGYRDEGDRVFVDRKLLESDPFFKGHFKRADTGAEAGAAQDGENADGGAENAAGNADGGAVNADGADRNADGADGNEGGQDELGLD